MFGIGFSDQAAESQMTAQVSSNSASDDTLTVNDAKTQDGSFEFIMLYQDGNGGRSVYGYDPVMNNQEP